jgi:PAS domain-containing protein
MTIHQLYLVLITLTIILNVISGLYIWRNRQLSVMKLLLWGIATVIYINLTFFILTVTPSIEVAYFSARARFLGLSLINVIYLLLALEYTQHGSWVTPLRIFAMSIIPVATQIVLWLTPGHTTFLQDWTLIRSADGFNTEYRILSGFHTVHALYTVFVMGVVFTLVLRHVTQIDSQKRVWLAWVMLAGIVASASTIFPLKLGDDPGLYLRPVTMGILTAVIALTLARSKSFGLMSLAYDLIYASMSDAVLVLNAQKRVIRANPAAERALGIPRRLLLKRTFAQIMPQVDDPDLFSDKLTGFEAGGAGRLVFLGKCQPIEVDHRPRGWLVVLHDVTEQRRAEANLSASERRAKALVEAVAKATSDQDREQALIVAEFTRKTVSQFRTPIQHLDVSVQALESASDPAERAALLSQIDTNVDVFNGMVSDLLKTISPPIPKP